MRLPCSPSVCLISLSLEQPAFGLSHRHFVESTSISCVKSISAPRFSRSLIASCLADGVAHARSRVPSA